MGCVTRKPRYKHQRNSFVLRIGTRKPGPANAWAAPIKAWHQLSPDRFVLHAGIDSNRPDTGDAVTFVEKVAADYLAVKFGHDSVETGVTQHRGHQFDSHVNRWEVGREMMCLRDRFERLVADRAAQLRILQLAAAKCKIHKLFRGSRDRGRSVQRFTTLMSS